MNTFPVEVRWLADIQTVWDTVDIRFTDRGVKTVECTALDVWRHQDGLPVDTPIRLMMIRDPDEDMIWFAFTNYFEDDAQDLEKNSPIVIGLKEILKMQRDCAIWIASEE